VRETSLWRRKIVDILRREWPESAECSPAECCDVELMLCAQQLLIPEEPASAGWALLTGYPFPSLRDAGWKQDHERVVNSVRHLLPYYRSRYSWQRALRHYQTVPVYLRGFLITADDKIERRDVTIAAGRFDHYQNTLNVAPAYKHASFQWADAGTYRVLDNNRSVEVTIPSELIDSSSYVSHSLHARTKNPPITVSWSELQATAESMDAVLHQTGFSEVAHWRQRLHQIHLDLLDANGKLQPADQMTIDGMMNYVGMVSAGKTTLITVLAVWLANHQYRVTLVVADVVNALDRAELLSHLGLSVAPVLGASNRERHINRLHRIHHARSAQSTPLQTHKGFHWLSTVCPLSGLMDQRLSADLSSRPCLALQKVDGEQTVQDATPIACPFFGRCAFHQAQRDLVHAQIWIATPASMVFTRVAPQVNRERLRFAELVYRTSDVVLVDEADQVQVLLDRMFSPSQTLSGTGNDAWLAQLTQQVYPRLNQKGRSQLAEQTVEAWCAAHDLAQMATSRVYGLLLQESILQRELTHDYFTARMLLVRIAADLYADAPSTSATLDADHEFMQEFDAFLNDPTGERHDSELSVIAQQLITHTDKARARRALTEWLTRKQRADAPPKTSMDHLALKFEFALVLAVLSDRLDLLLRYWKQAEVALQLDKANAMVFQQPPEDFAAVVPAAPMGNVLAFQYVKTDPVQPGELRFFRCTGVGRWLLLHYHELFVGDGVAGPHVMLFSGTSWAGNSPSYHIQLPVDGIVRAPASDVTVIADNSQFAFDPVFDDDQKPVFVSGKNGNDRLNALHTILERLTIRRGVRGDRPSQIEAERNSLPQNRQRILFLVGSYVEVEYVVESLLRLRPDWTNQVIGLVPDDDEDSGHRRGMRNLRRGLVHQFAETGAWLLVAPLLAVERGHNIMNQDNQAAIGSVFFLIRPHPRPDDINFAIQSINRWAVDTIDTQPSAFDDSAKRGLAADAERFREMAFRQWWRLLRLPMIYSTLPSYERDAVTWSQLVTIWQVIGRLVRGGAPARVHFVDAAFAPQMVADSENASRSDQGLLGNIRRVLRPYFENANSAVASREKAIVQTLYSPFYQALLKTKGLPES